MTVDVPPCAEAAPIRRILPIVVLLAAAAALVALRSACDGDDPHPAAPSAAGFHGAITSSTDIGRGGTPRRHAGSASCRECHRVIHDAWSVSQHARAEVPFDPATHGRAFDPAREVRHGTRTSLVRRAGDRCEIVTESATGETRSFVPERVLGIDPLWQVLVAGDGGRWQAVALAYDPARDEWFDVYGDEDRRPDEWGHWSNRGMCWNSMCASCHTTDFEKRYDPVDDNYDSRWVELGAGCESCHGGYADHVDAMRALENPGEVDSSGNVAVSWPPQAFLDALARDPTATREPRGRLDVVLDTCGACHARRSELTGRFVPGEKFLDHFRPVIPDETEVYFADGQVREEDYVFTSFLSSRMHRMGVRCVHCHEPHTTRLRAGGNELCLGCHRGKIDPLAHSHHDTRSSGAQCVGCHMPLTTYMQRDARRDHGFTIPDPALTRDYGVPNACNRCHLDKSVEWAVRHAESWYGKRLERHTQARARLIARARRGDATAAGGLLDVLAPGRHDDQSTLWRSVATTLLAAWAPERSDVAGAILAGLDSDDSLLRATSARVAESLLVPSPSGEHAIARRAVARLGALLDDSLRLVRIDAAWSLRRTLDLDAPAAAELAHSLELNSDQPAGALQRGVFHIDRAEGSPAELDTGIAWLERAVSWDPHSPPLHDHLAGAYGQAGRREDAIASLERARKIAPEQAVFALRLGLALAEAERLDEAGAQFEAACALDASFSRAWYNLALLRLRLEQPERAFDAIDHAIRNEPRDAHYRFTRASMLRDLDRRTEALETIREAERTLPGVPQLIEFRAFLLEECGDRAAAARAREELDAALRARR